ncbi:hypothetical protein LJR153_007186 [Paenibacillus sp. LjRoot153]|uniref:hypothetical protein n=1 Tax=Paenibacillus sp. LjRoot153 TaxID=3342270 RepID=UPI003ECE4A31
MNKQNYRRYWLKWEDELIIKYYPTVSIDNLLKHLPIDRNKRAIRDRAHKLGIKKVFGKKNDEFIEDSKYYKSSKLIKFYEYLLMVKNVSIKTGIKPNMDSVLKVFRDSL